jgi:hypothetical protein
MRSAPWPEGAAGTSSSPSSSEEHTFRDVDDERVVPAALLPRTALIAERRLVGTA